MPITLLHRFLTTPISHCKTLGTMQSSILMPDVVPDKLGQFGGSGHLLPPFIGGYKTGTNHIFVQRLLAESRRDFEAVVCVELMARKLVVCWSCQRFRAYHLLDHAILLTLVPARHCY